MENVEGKNMDSTHALYHRILQPAYERMILQNVYKNKITLKSGASGQLLHKRPKTTGYLGKKMDDGEYRSASAYWNPTASESWPWQQSIAPSYAPSVGYLQEATRSLPHPIMTDEVNLKTSSRANTFSATTRVREVPVSGIFKREIQEFRSRTPSGRGVRASALTNRSIIASQSALGVCINGKHNLPVSQQSVRMQREKAHLELTRERKKRSQLLSHRADRMYYMLGSSSKIHQKYAISEDDLDRLRAIAISKGMKLPSSSAYSHRQKPSTSGPHSTPRGVDDYDDVMDRQGSAKTIIPTADTVSVGGEVASLDEKDASRSDKEDRATSDHEGDGALPELDSLGEENDEEVQLPDGISVKSDSEVLKPDSVQNNVTFLTEHATE